MFSPRTPLVVLATVAALVLTACGGSTGASGGDSAAGHGSEHGGEEKTAAPVDGAPEITLNAVDIDYKPATLELKAGEATNVTVTNDGKALHDFTLEEADVHVNVKPGESKTFALTIDEPGTYEAVCTVAGHAKAGMTVDVTVT